MTEESGQRPPSDAGTGPGDDAGAEDGADGVDGAAESEDAATKTARLDALMRRYRATLRNEAEPGHEGFSADHYRSQKPPHW